MRKLGAGVLPIPDGFIVRADFADKVADSLEVDLHRATSSLKVSGNDPKKFDVFNVTEKELRDGLDIGWKLIYPGYKGEDGD